MKLAKSADKIYLISFLHDRLFLIVQPFNEINVFEQAPDIITGTTRSLYLGENSNLRKVMPHLSVDLTLQNTINGADYVSSYGYIDDKGGEFGCFGTRNGTGLTGLSWDLINDGSIAQCILLIDSNKTFY